ncbi:hypothetical protein LSTR_LSTR000736 [Laodelphax striatellus]|uniref:AMP-dependent synthetase/ligase domain-containing protein n=1 Tax=Laodelphax striatellus TaxID=195883 RepID=A0A482XGC9_LAOST|nr:hypothetical protein LSTR_LSTR000736 [Laodelphax striatellus]
MESLLLMNKQTAVLRCKQNFNIFKYLFISFNSVRLKSIQRPIKHYHKFHSNSNKKNEENSTNELALSIFSKALNLKDKVAVKDHHGLYTYSSLLQASLKLSKEYGEILQGRSGERVAFLCPNDSAYIFALWASWINGQIAVPLSPLHPQSMLEYFIDDSSARLLVTTDEYVARLEPISIKKGIKLVVLDNSLRDGVIKHTTGKREGKENDIEFKEGCEAITPDQIFHLSKQFYNENDALIIYTSGSTGMPKGVVVSHRSLQTQIENMLSAWGWSHSDCILHTLPLHHTHGIINALLCPLAAGAKCIILPSFDAKKVWNQFLQLDDDVHERINMFTGVPTMYVKLIEEYNESYCKTQYMIDFVRAVCVQKMRLFMCGSAPLPVQIFDRWKTITGHAILERYGMTETGMTLTNPLNGERLSGRVGTPFPSVRVRLVNSNDGSILSVGSSRITKLSKKTKEDVVTGELQVQGENVFKQYFNKPDKTAEEFTSDGWFKTGDYAEYDTKNNSYAILGRTSVDIIKTGGYKVSAIHVETSLRDHPDIDDLAIIGIPDFTWGQKVAAVIVPKPGIEIDLMKLKEWTKVKLPPYEIPSVYKVVSKIPRNAMGKVNKRDLAKELFPEGRMK